MLGVYYPVPSAKFGVEMLSNGHGNSKIGNLLTPHGHFDPPIGRRDTSQL